MGRARMGHRVRTGTLGEREKGEREGQRRARGMAEGRCSCTDGHLSRPWTADKGQGAPGETVVRAGGEDVWAGGGDKFDRGGWGWGREGGGVQCSMGAGMAHTGGAAAGCHFRGRTHNNRGQAKQWKRRLGCRASDPERARNQIEAGVAARREAIAMGTTKTLAVWSTEGGEGLEYARRAQGHSSACAGGRSSGGCVRERGRHAPCGMGGRANGGMDAIEKWQVGKLTEGPVQRGQLKKRVLGGAGGGLLGPAGIIGKGEPCVRDEGIKGAKASLGRGWSSGVGAARGKGGRAVHGLEV